jgi:hypothetical protein
VNWRALTDLVVWRMFGHEYDRIAAMRGVVKAAAKDPAIGRPIVKWGAAKWSRFALLTDAKGRSLIGSVVAKFRRAA